MKWLDEMIEDFLLWWFEWNSEMSNSYKGA